MTANELESRLNCFDPTGRAQALAELATQDGQGNLAGEPAREVANMHCHTFFSYNAYGYSPSGLAWLAKQRGFAAIGIVDFDVLDGVEEFLAACRTVGVRGSAALETRVFLPEYASLEINSPGEPGVYYAMGIGFTTNRAPGAGAPILADMRRRAESRNRAMLAKINAFLAPLQIDYERDVLPLTPSGNATERHMLSAYTTAAERTLADPTAFWAEKLGLPREQIAAQIGDSPKFQNMLRTKLMKRGGVGYAQPGADTFPALDELNQMTLACGAIPCATWLDGTTAGEQAMAQLLELQIAKGAGALNIIPDRNWNIPDPEVRRVKLNNLYQVVNLARQMDLPLNIGTEMNTYGQKLVDDFDCPELAPVRQAFIDGAYFIYGHTVMQQALGLGYQSAWAQAHLPTRRAKNTFYTQMGRLAPPTMAGFNALKAKSDLLIPDQFLLKLR